MGIYAAVVFFGGALLAPWNYWLIQTLATTFPALAKNPFERYVTTSMMIVAVAGLYPLLRSLNIKSLRETGLVNPKGHGKELLAGLSLGLVSLATVAGLVLLSGARDLDFSLSTSRLVRRLSIAAISAAGVAVIEETLFRGGIFGGLRRVIKWPFALIVSSMIYSGVHFLEDAAFKEAITWHSGLELLPRLFGGGDPWSEVLPRFVNLTVAGMLLGLAYQRTGTLWFSIGLHCGWIFCLATYRALTESVQGTSRWLWGSGKMIDGWLALISLVLALALFARSPWGREKQASP